MAIGDNGRGRRGCLVGALVLACAALALIVSVLIWLGRAAGDPTSTGYELLRVVRGEMPAEEFVTEAIIDRMAKKAGVPPDEVAALKRELGPITRDLPRLSEGEKEKLANLIRGAVEDGRVTDDELATIRLYSYESARDGNVKP
ncbi:MAG TPA: hypothetical protein VMX79_02420 [bacterium]|nr:hypothetical protein [bacterium]